MNTPADIILAAQYAAEKAKRPIQPPPNVDLILVNEILKRIPDKAREGRKDPEARAFSIGSWDPADQHAQALWATVCKKLANELGLDVAVATRRIGAREAPCEAFIHYDDLAHCAGLIQEHRDAWIADVSAAWKERFGDAGRVVIEPSYFGLVCAFYAPPRSEEDADWLVRPGQVRELVPKWTTGTNWMELEPRQVVEQAFHELSLMRWSFHEIAKLWAEGTGGEVKRSRGLWSEDGVKPIPTLIFALEDHQTTVAIEDVGGMPAEALVEEMLRKIEGEMRARTDAKAKKTAEEQARAEAAVQAAVDDEEKPAGERPQGVLVTTDGKVQHGQRPNKKNAGK